jgi:hypothetical protein
MEGTIGVCKMATLGNEERKRMKKSFFFVSLHIVRSERKKNHPVTAIFIGMANMPYIIFNVMQMGFPCFLCHQSVAS